MQSDGDSLFKPQRPLAMLSLALLNSIPLAPKGGISMNAPVDFELHVVGSVGMVQLFGLRRSSVTHADAGFCVPPHCEPLLLRRVTPDDARE